MSRFIYFLQNKGCLTCLAHLGVGLFTTCFMTILGYACDGIQVLGVYVSRIFLWQSYLLWIFLRSGFIERYENDSPVYAGIPYVLVWFIGILSGVPIYTLLSMAIHYIRSEEFNE